MKRKCPISLPTDSKIRASVPDPTAAPTELPISSTSPPALDLTKLRNFASVPENSLEHIALALEVTEADIRAAIAPKTWKQFQSQCIAASEVKCRAAINHAAEAGDLRRVEFLLAAGKQTEGCPHCQQLAALSDEELRDRAAKLQAVLDMPGTAVEAWPQLRQQ